MRLPPTIVAGRLPTAALLVVAVVASLLVVPPASAQKPSLASDHGFPLDQYLHGIIAGKVFVGGNPPKIVGAKTKDSVFVVNGRARYQPQLAFRRASRDNGKGRFLVLQARSWGSALAHVIQLDPGTVKFFRIAFPKAIGGTPFPPLYAGIVYTFEVAPDSPAPQFEAVQVASAPHPDPAQRTRGVTLVTLKRGLTPGTYVVRVSAEVGLTPHPLTDLYDAYERATGVVEWITIALAPGEAALEKLVDTAIETLVERAAAGDAAAQAAVRTQALRERVAMTVAGEAVKTALTKSAVVARIEVPTVVPELRGLSTALARRKLQERFLQLDAPATSPGVADRVKSQSPGAGQKVKVGTPVHVKFEPPAGQAPPTGLIACKENWWRGTWKRLEHAGEVTFNQNGATMGGATHTWYGGGTFTEMKLSPDCRTMTGRAPRTATIADSRFEIHLRSSRYFTGNWRWATTPEGSWNGSFSGAK